MREGTLHGTNIEKYMFPSEFSDTT